MYLVVSYCLLLNKVKIYLVHLRTTAQTVMTVELDSAKQHNFSKIVFYCFFLKGHMEVLNVFREIMNINLRVQSGFSSRLRRY